MNTFLKVSFLVTIFVGVSNADWFTNKTIGRVEIHPGSTANQRYIEFTISDVTNPIRVPSDQNVMFNHYLSLLLTAKTSGNPVTVVAAAGAGDYWVVSDNWSTTLIRLE